MASCFSDVMWLIEQIMWKSLGKRVADFLLEESSIEDTNELKITHPDIKLEKPNIRFDKWWTGTESVPATG